MSDCRFGVSPVNYPDPDPDQSFICYLVYLLWTSIKISSQEAKGPISIADMCIPSQIICDSDPKIRDTFDIFEDRSPQNIYVIDMLHYSFLMQINYIMELLEMPKAKVERNFTAYN